MGRMYGTFPLWDGMIGAQIKTAPGGALTPNSQGLADYKAQPPTPKLTEDEILLEWDWLITPNGQRLHYAGLNRELAADLTYYGMVENIFLACGRWVESASIPGIFTRMGAERCQLCCDRLGYPRGKGSPKNDDACRPLVEAKIGGTA